MYYKNLLIINKQARRLVELVNNSRNAVVQLTEYHNLGEKILKTAELARRLETEKEKVLPFYDNTTTDDEIPEDLQRAFSGIFFNLRNNN